MELADDADCGDRSAHRTTVVTYARSWPACSRVGAPGIHRLARRTTRRREHQPLRIIRLIAPYRGETSRTAPELEYCHRATLVRSRSDSGGIVAEHGHWFLAGALPRTQSGHQPGYADTHRLYVAHHALGDCRLGNTRQPGREYHRIRSEPWYRRNSSRIGSTSRFERPLCISRHRARQAL